MWVHAQLCVCVCRTGAGLSRALWPGGLLGIDTSGLWTVGVAPDGVSAAGVLQDDSGSRGALGVELP